MPGFRQDPDRTYIVSIESLPKRSKTLTFGKLLQELESVVASTPMKKLPSPAFSFQQPTPSTTVLALTPAITLTRPLADNFYQATLQVMIECSSTCQYMF